MKKDSQPPATKPPANKPPAGRIKASVASFKVTATTARPITVEHHKVPPAYEQRERIHARRILRRVKEGQERDFHSQTREIGYHLQMAMPSGPRDTTDDLVLVVNSELTQPATQQLASSVGEPSVAAKDNVVMYTGNWYAARSIDGGQTFQFIDPFKAFPDPPNLGMCCDQVVNYIASIDTFVWLLQYGPKTGPDIDNLQRLAFARTADVANGKWRLFDITTDSLDLKGMFLDFPDLAVGANFLYVTSNVFNGQGRSNGAALVRIPFAEIDSGSITVERFISPDFDSLRVAQNCKTTAFFAAHSDTSTLRLFSWDEAQPAPTAVDVGVARWIGGMGYQSRTPDGNRWLDRVDPRITGAAMAGNELWFAWSVDQNSNHRPQPFVQIARIDAGNLTLLENINVFDPDSAIAYGALSSNSDGEVGTSYMIGGGERFPSHMVGILTPTRKDVLTSTGERSPLDSQWGDYLTVRPVFPLDKKLFAATGYTMKGSGDGSNRDATPRYVVFGRSGVAQPGTGTGTGTTPAPDPGTPPPAPPIPPGPPPVTPAVDGGPITDVNALSIVSTAVANQIKTAAGLTPGAGPQKAALQAALPLPQADKPGKERWPVKTGQDPDRAKVGKNIIAGVDLGAGIVQATVEELISIPRPPGMEVATQDPPQFQSVRDGVVEITIWQVSAKITAIKHEADGDYHLVLQGESGQEMVAEIPTPTTVFVGDSPWLDNIKQARQEIDGTVVKHLSPQAFTLWNNKYVPLGSLPSKLRATASPRLSFQTPEEGSAAIQPLFATRLDPIQVKITGVGFFDRAHGATGAAPNVIELHPVLKVEFGA
jgi:hypothetical protein